MSRGHGSSSSSSSMRGKEHLIERKYRTGRVDHPRKPMNSYCFVNCNDTFLTDNLELGGSVTFHALLEAF